MSRVLYSISLYRASFAYLAWQITITVFAFLSEMISERVSIAMFTMGDANSLPFSSASGCQEDGSFQAGMRGNTSLQIE